MQVNIFTKELWPERGRPSFKVVTEYLKVIKLIRVWERGFRVKVNNPHNSLLPLSTAHWRSNMRVPTTDEVKVWFLLLVPSLIIQTYSNVLLGFRAAIGS
jgi:hypothetical protein